MDKRLLLVTASDVNINYSPSGQPLHIVFSFLTTAQPNLSSSEIINVIDKIRFQLSETG